MKKWLLLIVLLVGCTPSQPQSMPPSPTAIELMVIEVNPPNSLTIQEMRGERMTFCVSDKTRELAEVDVYINFASTTYTPAGPAVCNVTDLTDLRGNIRQMLAEMLFGLKQDARKQLNIRIHSDDETLRNMSEVYQK